MATEKGRRKDLRAAGMAAKGKSVQRAGRTLWRRQAGKSKEKVI